MNFWLWLAWALLKTTFRRAFNTFLLKFFVGPSKNLQLFMDGHLDSLFCPLRSFSMFSRTSSLQFSRSSMVLISKPNLSKNRCWSCWYCCCNSRLVSSEFALPNKQRLIDDGFNDFLWTAIRSRKFWCNFGWNRRFCFDSKMMILQTPSLAKLSMMMKKI